MSACLRALWSRLPEPWREALRVYLCVRVMASAVAVLGIGAMPQLAIPSQMGYVKPAYSKLFELLFGVWERWDGIWYLGIAQFGYDKDLHAAAFMPLYPMLVRLVGTVTFLPWIVAALLVSNLAFIWALRNLQEIAERLAGPEAARRALWYVALFPGGLFMLAPYTEALFLALSTLAFVAAFKGRWWQAGLAGGALALTRNMGAAIALPLAVEFFRQRKLAGAGKSPEWPQFLWLLLIPASVGGMLIYWQVHSGDPLTFIKQVSHWERKPMLPWEAVWGGFRQAWDFVLIYPGGVYQYHAAAVLAGLVLGGFAIFTLPASLTIFLWFTLFPPFTAVYTGNMLSSCIRYLSVIFPIFLTLAIRVKSPTVDQGIRVALAAAYGLAVALYVTSQNLF